jgi:lauroyl/myristoyl acyltransferase
LTIRDQIVAARGPCSSPPLFAAADLLGFVYAYPLCGLARRFPKSTIWAVNTIVAPFYRRMRESDRRRVAGRMRHSLEIPASEADALAGRWMNHLIRRACYDLLRLSGKAPVSCTEFTGREHLDRELSVGRGVLLVCVQGFAGIPAKHLLRRMGYSILSVRGVRPPKSWGRAARRWLVPRLRRLSEKVLGGSIAVSADDPGCALRLAQALRDGSIVDIAADASTSGTSVSVPFLKGRRPISRGVLDLARLCGCPVLPLVAVYSTDGIRIEIGEPLQHLDLSALVNELERQVRAYPDQWQEWLNLEVT